MWLHVLHVNLTAIIQHRFNNAALYFEVSSFLPKRLQCETRQLKIRQKSFCQTLARFINLKHPLLS